MVRVVPVADLKPGDVYVMLDRSGMRWPGTAGAIRTFIAVHRTDSPEPTVILSYLMEGQVFVRHYVPEDHASWLVARLT